MLLVFLHCVVPCINVVLDGQLGIRRLGFFALIAVEAITGQGFLQLIGIQVRAWFPLAQCRQLTYRTVCLVAYKPRSQHSSLLPPSSKTVL